MNKGSILKRFLYFLLAFLIFYIEQIPTIYLGVKDTRLVCLLVVVSLLISIGALFLGNRLELFEGFKSLSSLKAWGKIGLTYLGIFRGLLMGRVFNPDSIVGLIFSSLLFGLIHRPNSIGVWIVYAGMGFALGIAYRKFQKLEYCIMAHIINNSIAVSMLLLLQVLAPYIK